MRTSRETQERLDALGATLVGYSSDGGWNEAKSYEVPGQGGLLVAWFPFRATRGGFPAGTQFSVEVHVGDVRDGPAYRHPHAR